jgi:hypothetical protein
MCNRVEGKPSGKFCSRIAEPVGNKTMRDLMKCDGYEDRYNRYKNVMAMRIGITDTTIF